MKTKSRQSLVTLIFSLCSVGWIQAASTIQFSAATYTLPEGVGAATLTIQRTGDTNAEVGVDYTTADGTATNGLKYTAVSGRLTFGGGETNKVIPVPVLNNGLVDGTKNFRVILSNPTGGAVLGARTNVLVLLTDDDEGIELFTDNDTIAEDTGGVVFGVVRGDDGKLPITVEFVTANLIATSGTDYAGTTNRLSFGPHELLKFITVPILNDSLKEVNETFRVTLSNPVGVTLATQAPLTVTIVDNDQGFAFEFDTYSVTEDAGVARINVLRGTDDTNSAVTVDFATSDLAAINGLDYTGTTKALSFAAGEKVKLVTVPILNDGVRESNKSFRVTLKNPTGGAVLGLGTTASVTILDNDPGIRFEFSSYSVWENAGVLGLAVLRGNDMALGPIIVNYATTNLTAKAGQEYEAGSGTLVFVENETVKSIFIPILRNGSATNDMSFKVSLSNPTGGTLGTASTTVNILDASGLTSRAVAPRFDTALTIRDEGGRNLITWAGGGQLQRADRPMGPWQTLTAAANPFSVQSPLPTTFYRVTRPRQVDVHIPSSYDGQTPLPLVIMLHGYTSSAANHEAYMRFSPLAQARGFLYCYPNGTIDIHGDHFWNATDACCDYYNSGVDDAGYLRDLIEEIGSRFSVDRKRIYLIGHSNGGYMAYRMACQYPDLIAGIASLAGMTFLDPSRCQPSQPVNILQIHGTGDISYLADPFQPGALQGVQFWAKYNGAAGLFTEAAPAMNLDLAVPGLDTVITRYTNAPPGGAVELWTINGGGHFPTLSSGSSASEFAPRVIDWLLAHPKP